MLSMAEPGGSFRSICRNDKDDKANNRKVLEEMAGAADDHRSARFKCVLAGSFPDGGNLY